MDLPNEQQSAANTFFSFQSRTESKFKTFKFRGYKILCLKHQKNVRMNKSARTPQQWSNSSTKKGASTEAVGGCAKQSWKLKAIAIPQLGVAGQIRNYLSIQQHCWSWSFLIFRLLIRNRRRLLEYILFPFDLSPGYNQGCGAGAATRMGRLQLRLLTVKDYKANFNYFENSLENSKEHKAECLKCDLPFKFQSAGTQYCIWKVFFGLHFLF